MNYYCSLETKVREKIKKKLSDEKFDAMPTINDRLKEKYGAIGTPSREAFEARAKAWYYAELLKEERKRQKLTQQQLADKIGKKREYISTIERGNCDMQMSTFLQIASALGLRFSLVVG